MNGGELEGWGMEYCPVQANTSALARTLLGVPWVNNRVTNIRALSRHCVVTGMGGSPLRCRTLKELTVLLLLSRQKQWLCCSYGWYVKSRISRVYVVTGSESTTMLCRAFLEQLCCYCCLDSRQTPVRNVQYCAI